MAWRISTEQLDAIRARAAASPGDEICGLLLGRGETVEEVRPCRNVAADPARRFEIDPAALIAAYRQARAGGATIIGCYHSHPTGRAEPSPRDAAAADPNGWLWVIATASAVTAWRAVDGGDCHGRFDAVALPA